MGRCARGESERALTARAFAATPPPPARPLVAESAVYRPLLRPPLRKTEGGRRQGRIPTLLATTALQPPRWSRFGPLAATTPPPAARRPPRPRPPRRPRPRRP